MFAFVLSVTSGSVFADAAETDALYPQAVELEENHRPDAAIVVLQELVRESPRSSRVLDALTLPLRCSVRAHREDAVEEALGLLADPRFAPDRSAQVRFRSAEALERARRHEAAAQDASAGAR